MRPLIWTSASNTRTAPAAKYFNAMRYGAKGEIKWNYLSKGKLSYWECCYRQLYWRCTPYIYQTMLAVLHHEYFWGSTRCLLPFRETLMCVVPRGSCRRSASNSCVVGGVETKSRGDRYAHYPSDEIEIYKIPANSSAQGSWCVLMTDVDAPDYRRKESHASGIALILRVTRMHTYCTRGRQVCLDGIDKTSAK